MSHEFNRWIDESVKAINALMYIQIQKSLLDFGKLDGNMYLKESEWCKQKFDELVKEHPEAVRHAIEVELADFLCDGQYDYDRKILMETYKKIDEMR